jgi:amino acid adenylation domain-containing protein
VTPQLAPGEALAHVMYTSGSTGRPKGVMVTHRGVLRLVTRPNHFEFAPGQRMLQTSSAGFDASTLEVWGMLLNGGTLVQVPADVLLDPEAGAAALHTHQVDLMFLTTPLFHRWASDHPQAFAPLRQLMVGGDVLPTGSAALVRRLHPGLRLLNAYGPTENTTLSTFHVLASPPQEAVPIGRPVNGTCCEVLDVWGRAVPPGVAGELWVGGDGLAGGYLNDAETTARCFVGLGEARRYRTGDLVRVREDGELDFLGRIDQQVKIRGQRVEPEEVEWHLQQHPALREAAVVVCDDASGGKCLVAFCVPQADAAPDPAAWLDAHLRTCLPAALRPQRYEVVQALPLNTGGKVDRGALRRRPLAMLPARPQAEAPATPAQRQVLAAWQASLGVAAIGLDEGFHSLGGDSLKAIRVCTLLRREGWRLRVSDLMRHPTIRHCAERLERIEGEAAPQAQGDTAPLSPVQLRFLGRGLANPHHFVIPLLLRVKRPLPASTLRDAALHALQGQDGPFVRFMRDAATGAWQQQRMPWTPADWFERIELSDADPGPQVAQHAERVCRSFDLHAGPLFRVTCFERDGHVPLVHLVFHHLVCDGISLGVLLERMRAFLAAPGPAQPPARSYLQWCRLLQRHAGEAADARRAYWTQVLAGGEPLPRRPPHHEMATQAHETLRDAAEIEACTRRAARHGASLFALLLAAMVVALRRTGLAPPALHIQTAQREPVLAGEAIDLHDTLGYCSAAVPVRVPQLQAVDEMLAALSQPLRELPETAPGYLALRHLRAELDDRCTVMFHYLAEDPLQRADDIFEPSDLPAGPSTDRGNESAYLLNLTVARRASRLETTCYFSPAHYRAGDIQRLAATFREVLQAACAEHEEPR